VCSAPSSLKSVQRSHGPAALSLGLAMESMESPSPSAEPMGAERTAAEEAFMQEWPQLSLQASSADYYFNSYNHYGVHEDVLKDSVTMTAFVKAILHNAHLFRGAVVLDVGAGLGILSLLAAKAGAKKVIALETQKELVMMGEKVARKNGFGPDVLEFVCGSAGTLEKLPDGLEQVDIVMGEWMGYFLMYESRLGDVLKARDRWLKPGGLMFPDRAKLYVALMEDAQYVDRHFNYYAKVWGFDYSVMRAPAQTEPVVNAFAPSQLLSTTPCVLDLDLRKCSVSDCFDMAAPFQCMCKREGKVHALLSWFEIRFDVCHKPVSFGTGPKSPATCWKQVAFFLNSSVPRHVRHNERVRGMLAVRKRSEERRHLDIKIVLEEASSEEPQVHFYRWT